MHRSSRVNRRAVLLAGFSAVISSAGCLGDLSGDSGPRERTFRLSVTRSDGSLAASIEPEGEVEGVVRINVGDTVTFEVANEAGVPIGVHNHATGEEVVVEADAETAMEFEATESMTGRQEIEGWTAEGDASGGADGHGEDATALVVVEVRPRGG